MHTARNLSKEEFKAWNEQMAKDYNPDTYHESASGIVSWVERSRVRTICRLLSVQPDESVLEVGVGAGNILAKFDAAVRTGIDISPFLLEKAQKRLGVATQLVEGNAEELDRHFPPHSFDKVFCSEVLEHVQHPDRVIAQMARMLKPGGIAVVSVPNESVINRLKRLLKSIGVFRLLFPDMADHMEDAWHLHMFSAAMLRSLADRHFHILQIVAVPFWFLPIRLVAQLSARPMMEELPRMLRCPFCHAALLNAEGGLFCTPCSRTFAVQDGVPIFLPGDSDAGAHKHGENRFKNFFKQWPRLYHALVFLVGPSLLTGLTSRKFVERYGQDSSILHAGSGPRRLAHQCVNVDIENFEGVDVVADIRHLPFADGTFDVTTCDQVLEHVPQPHLAARELSRVVKPGGLIHVATPFLFPWHPSPSDYSRWTTEGLGDLFPGHRVVEAGIMAGPFSALNAFLPAFFSTILCFGSLRLQFALQYFFLVLCMPLKFFDFIFIRMKGVELCAAGVYIVVEKPL